MKLSLTQKISILLIIPAVGALIALSIVYVYLNQMGEEGATINLAGRQRMLSKQLYIYADMVIKGQEEDRPILRETIDSFDLALETLANGGQVMGHPISPAPTIAMDELIRVKATWLEYKKAADLVAGRAMDDPQARQAFDYIVTNSQRLTNDSNRLVTVIEANHLTLQQRMFSTLVAVAVFDVLLLFIGVVLTRRYIAERKQAESALQQSEARNRAIVNEAADGIVTIDEKGAIQTFSPAAERIFGYARDEVIGQNVNLLIPEPVRRQHDGYLCRYRETGDAHFIGFGPREVVALHRDGCTFPIELAINEVRQDEQRRFYVGILRDITKRKQAEEKLRLSEERFTLVTRGTQDGLWDWDLTSGKIYFSPRWTAMFGYHEDEIENNFHAWQGLIHPDDLGLALDAWLSCMEGDSDAFSFEYRLRCKQGDYRWVNCRGLSVRNSDNEPVRMAGSHTDITERKRIEKQLLIEHAEQQALIEKLGEAQEQLLQSEKMASIGQLAAGVAHEINNPVGYINSNMGSLKQYLEDLFKLLEVYEQAEPHITDNASKQVLTAMKAEVDVCYFKQDLKDLLTESEEGVQRVKQIVQDLKDFSHVDEAEWQWADLHKGIDSTLNVVRNEIKYKAEVIKDYGELPEVQCLASQLNQVFMNLLVNAAHAIEEHGTITVRTGSKDKGVWVEIEDTGKGMDAETSKKIFEPFFTTKPVGSGTGLGLSLSYGIIQKHNGTITVASEVGKGTRFHIWLPIEQEEQRAAS